jgi:biopolymer transport protein TolQ
MEEAVVSTITHGGMVSPDLSIFGLFLEADFIVKLVIIILVFCSFWCWAIIFEKSLRIRRLGRMAERFEKNFWSGGSLEDLYDRMGERATHPMAVLFGAAMREWRRSSLQVASGSERQIHGVEDRIAHALEVTLNREQVELEKYLGFLATVGSTAPFIGLFGTVWGIMNSFIGIAEQQTTNLAVVAPGIAEALLATALGLVAAIPAVVIYNHFARAIAAHRAVVADSAAALLRVVSRDLSRGTLPEGKV